MYTARIRRATADEWATLVIRVAEGDAGVARRLLTQVLGHVDRGVLWLAPYAPAWLRRAPAHLPPPTIH